MNKKPEIQWLPEPADSDYDAAETFLSLLYKPKDCRRWAKRLRRAKMSNYPAKDILRASATPMSEVKAFDWSKQREQIERGTPLSPILIIRQENGERLIIADGFHRICALFAADQEVNVPCKIA